MDKKRGITNIEKAILFLCTMVINSTMKYKENLKRVLQLLKQKINDKRVMGEDNLIQLCTWVNAASGVHTDLKIHTSSGMSFGYWIVHCKYRKLKLNQKIYTKDKVVRVSDYLPYKIWI